MLDPELGKRFQAGDREAFGQIIELYQQRLFRMGWRLFGNASDAHDFAQNAFIHVYEQRRRFDSRRPFEPWFYKVALNVGRESLRRRREIPCSDSLPDPSVGPEADKQMEQEEKRKRVSRVLQGLKPKHREILSLRFESGMALAEIAQVLKTRLGTVKSRLSRGLEAFQQAYLQQGGEPNDMS